MSSRRIRSVVATRRRVGPGRGQARERDAAEDLASRQALESGAAGRGPHRELVERRPGEGDRELARHGFAIAGLQVLGLREAVERRLAQTRACRAATG